MLRADRSTNAAQRQPHVPHLRRERAHLLDQRDDAGVRPVCIDEPLHGVPHPDERILGASVGMQRGQHGVDHALGHRAEDRVFGVEVGIEAALRDIRCRHDVGDPGVQESPPLEDQPRRGQQLGLARLSLVGQRTGFTPSTLTSSSSRPAAIVKATRADHA